MSREIIDREHVGRLMHESWSRTKRAQGFHGPRETCPENPTGQLIRHKTNPTFNNCVCLRQHTDLIPWDNLPEPQKDIKRHAFDYVLPYFERLLADEREKVRELCAKELVVLCNQWEALTSGELDNDGVAACRSGIAAIRQLDLTKPESDLAASSREEGEKEKT